MEGLEEYEQAIREHVERVEDIVPDMLKAGAAVIASAMRARLASMGIGSIASSMMIGDVKEFGMGRYIPIYPDGTQSHGNPFRRRTGKASNMFVGYLLEYGTSNMPARPWLSVAERSAEAAAHEAARKVWEERQNV
jgi:hypothetical protein